MAEIQHEDAAKLLRVIASSQVKSNASTFRNSTLTYTGVAELMGRNPPKHHAKAVAQMCDLLDAAACFAGVPLLALVAVREVSMEVNQKAWSAEYGPRRKAIINRSLAYNFGDGDFKAISEALKELYPRGNRAAWNFLSALYPGELLYRRVIGDYTGSLNAIDDIGMDVPGRGMYEVWLYNRNPQVREVVLGRANGRCEFCGSLGFLKPDGTRYLESHHIIALADEGEDRLSNVIALCSNDHREAHFGARAEALEEEMISKLQIIVGQPMF